MQSWLGVFEKTRETEPSIRRVLFETPFFAVVEPKERDNSYILVKRNSVLKDIYKKIKQKENNECLCDENHIGRPLDKETALEIDKIIKTNGCRCVLSTLLDYSPLTIPEPAYKLTNQAKILLGGEGLKSISARLHFLLKDKFTIDNAVVSGTNKGGIAWRASECRNDEGRCVYPEEYSTHPATGLFVGTFPAGKEFFFSMDQDKPSLPAYVPFEALTKYPGFLGESIGAGMLKNIGSESEKETMEYMEKMNIPGRKWPEAVEKQAIGLSGYAVRLLPLYCLSPGMTLAQVRLSCTKDQLTGHFKALFKALDTIEVQTIGLEDYALSLLEAKRGTRFDCVVLSASKPELVSLLPADFPSSNEQHWNADLSLTLYDYTILILGRLNTKDEFSFRKLVLDSKAKECQMEIPDDFRFFFSGKNDGTPREIVVVDCGILFLEKFRPVPKTYISMLKVSISSEKALPHIKPMELSFGDCTIDTIYLSNQQIKFSSRETEKINVKRIWQQVSREAVIPKCFVYKKSTSQINNPKTFRGHQRKIEIQTSLTPRQSDSVSSISYPTESDNSNLSLEKGKVSFSSNGEREKEAAENIKRKIPKGNKL